MDGRNNDFNRFLDDPFNLYDLSITDVLRNDLLNNLHSVDQLLLILHNLNWLFDDLLHLHWHFHHQGARFLDLNQLFTLYDLGYDLLDDQFLGYFIADGHDLLNRSVDDLLPLYYLLNRDDLLNDLLHWFFDLDVDVLDLLHLHWFFDFNDLLNCHLHFSHGFTFDDLLDDDLNDLRHFHDLLDDPGYDYDLLNDLLNLHNLRHFHQLLHDLLDSHLDFLDAFDSAWHLHDLLDHALHHLDVSDVLHYGLLDLDNLGLVDYLFCEDLDGDYLRYVHFFDDYLGDFFRDTDDLFLDEGDFDLSVDDLLDLLDLLHHNVVDSLDLLDLNDRHELFLDHLNFLDNSFNRSHWDWFFDDLDDLNDGLGDGLDWHKFLNVDGDFLDDLLDGDLGLSYNFNDLLGDDLLLYDLDLHYLGHFDHLLDDALHVNWHFDDLLNDFLDRDDLFFVSHDFLDLRDNVVDRYLDLDNFGVDHDPFNDLLNLDDLGHFHLALDDLLLNGGNLHNFLRNSRHFDQLLNDVINYLHNFHWHVDNLLDLHILGYFDDLFHILLNRDHLRYFHDSLHSLLDDLLYLDDLGG